MKLNLGAGRQALDGWTGVDLSHADVALDLGIMPWPWADGSVREILASHILEHFDKAGGRAFLRECYRILEPGGALRLAVPDMDKFITCRLALDWAPLDGYVWTDLNAMMGGGLGEPEPWQRHYYMYCFESLAYTLGRIGFRWVTRRGPCEFDNPAYHAISLYLDARR